MSAYLYFAKHVDRVYKSISKKKLKITDLDFYNDIDKLFVQLTQSTKNVNHMILKTEFSRFLQKHFNFSE